MKKQLARGEGRGGVRRVPRGYYAAALPLILPLVVLATRNASIAPAAEILAAASANLPSIDLGSTLSPAANPLPPHALYLTVDDGDTLDAIFVAGGLTLSESANLTSAFARSVDPRRLKIGDLVRFHYDESMRVDFVEMKITGWGQIQAERTANGFVVREAVARTTTVESTIAAEIDSSLYDALRRAGEKPQLAGDLVEVFQWDIDFFTLKKGDSFSFVTKKTYAGEDHTGYGPIVAARFHHNGRVFEAYRFDAPDGRPGYYTADGKPLKKQFLKSPLKYTRVTSGFSRRRFHPVLNRFRPHYGIDYGAPTGTPVMSTADGVVVASGYRAGEGNFIRIKHNSRIETSYLHLSRFAKGLRKGSQITQGDVIGYVGSTGLATGPHLDYRVCDAGKWLNPLELKSITADPLVAGSLSRFRSHVARYSREIGQGSTQLARNKARISHRPSPRDDG
ncbi:MAG TPA: peptidoglycan DD-metalloendopeptidase family protein [Thermoanaerobaculia bacterium]|nr:peptidoglycan DD-metalloendopeptidase family protein [Thermoanaerobaculia bacterium]